MCSQSVIVTLETRKEQITSKFNFFWENLDIAQVNNIFQISEKMLTNGSLPAKK